MDKPPTPHKVKSFLLGSSLGLRLTPRYIPIRNELHGIKHMHSSVISSRIAVLASKLSRGRIHSPRGPVSGQDIDHRPFLGGGSGVVYRPLENAVILDWHRYLTGLTVVFSG